MSSAEGAAPLAVAEARLLFADLADAPALILAVSGGPDSTALLWLAARWRKARRHGPHLIAITVDHGLRPEARREAAAVKRLAGMLGVPHRTMRWSGPKPTTGIQQAARLARYRLLAAAARRAGARHVLTAHTADDQAETVLMRLVRGSGPAGLGAMARIAPLPGAAKDAESVTLVRPLLDVPKARLVATLCRAGVAYAVDPSNADPRYTRARLRGVMPALAREGLSAPRLATLAARMRRAEAALEAALDTAWAGLAPGPDRDGAIDIPAPAYDALPAEIALRMLGRAMGRCGDEGPVELGKLEALGAALAAAGSARFRRTLAGAVVTRAGGRIVIARAPARRRKAARIGLDPDRP